MSTTADAPWPAAHVAWLRDPVARNYLFVGLASLLIAAAVLVFRHGHLLAALPVAIAALGLLLRSPVMPGLFLVVLNLAVVPLTVWMSRTRYFRRAGQPLPGHGPRPGRGDVDLLRLPVPAVQPDPPGHAARRPGRPAT